MLNIIAAVLVFGLIVLVHEFGHFLLAKKNGIVVVEEFSLGMGPRLLSYSQRRDQVFTEAAADRRFLHDAGRR